MPNYCSNTLIIQYDNYDFLRGLQTFDFDFDVFHPSPKHLSDEETILWRMKNWSTKWSCINPKFTFIDDSHLKIDFETAWMPPIEFLKVFSSRYPEMFLSLQYEEIMNGFYGNAEFEKGSAIIHNHHHHTDEELQKIFDSCNINVSS